MEKYHELGTGSDPAKPQPIDYSRLPLDVFLDIVESDYIFK